MKAYIIDIGSSIGVKSVVIVGGMDMISQALQLAKKPHILIATPGRLVDHLENTKGFSLRALKFLVITLFNRFITCTWIGYFILITNLGNGRS